MTHEHLTNLVGGLTEAATRLTEARTTMIQLERTSDIPRDLTHRWKRHMDATIGGLTLLVLQVGTQLDKAEGITHDVH